MGWVPSDAEWWLADLVEAITVEGEKRIVRHINRCLIRAPSREAAWTRAMALGRESTRSWRNSDGQRVRGRFLGLAQLLVLHDGVEDGAEIEYFEKHCRSVDEARRVVRRKKELSVFVPYRPPRSVRPNYIPARVADAFRKEFGTELVPARKARRRR